MNNQKAAATATLMDEQRHQVGRAYGARTTPHMYVIDPRGTLVYAGAIDSKPIPDIKTRQPGAGRHRPRAYGARSTTSRRCDRPGRVCWPARPVSVAARPFTSPYGCTVEVLAVDVSE
jgi:hypothetical protein